MKVKIIKVTEFSRYPSGRVIADGPNSGEKFRRDHLIPALKENEKVIVIIDGVNGYPSSFTEEAFGGLVRLGEFPKQDILDKIEIRCESSVYEGYKKEMLEAMEVAEQNCES